MNFEERIKVLQKDILADDKIVVDDRVVDLVELLYKRIDELLATIEDIHDREEQIEDDRYHYDRNDLD